LKLPEFFCARLTDLSPTGNFLFNQKAHLLLQSKTGWVVYGLNEEKTGHVVVKISFCVKEGIAYSPYRAPFGGWELGKKVDDWQANFFIVRLMEDLKRKGAKKIVIKSNPLSYAPSSAQLFLEVAKKLGYGIHQEISSIIPVDRTPFERKIAIAKRQKLIKGAARFSFHQENQSQLRKIYDFIEVCRQERNQTLSMPFLQLKKTMEMFPHDYLLFSAKENEKLAAAAIVVRINDKILYTFYYAHARHFDKVSPVVFLIRNLYLFAKKNKYRMIDLGTSTVHGRTNQALLHFKKSIGGLSFPKYSFEIEL
jgi:hypothetical protein